MDIVPAAPDTNQQLSYLLPEFINFSLPNARPRSHVWTRENGTQTMTITAGTTIGPDRAESFVPYGKYARAALLFLCTEAGRPGRNGDAVIRISDSYRGFVKQLGVSYSRVNAAEAVRQMQAIAACTIAVHNKSTRDDGVIDATTERYLISAKDRMIFASDRSGTLVEHEASSIELSPDFMRLIATSGRVPVRTDVWTHLLRTARSPMTLDIYVWLAYRLHHLKGSTPISWDQLHKQFGSGTELKDFTRKFKHALAEALAVYPEASVTDLGKTVRGGTHGIRLSMSKNAADSVWPASPEGKLPPES